MRQFYCWLGFFLVISSSIFGFVVFAKNLGDGPHLIAKFKGDMDKEADSWVRAEREDKNQTTGRRFFKSVIPITVNAKLLQNEEKIAATTHYLLVVDLINEKPLSCVLTKGSKRGEGKNTIWSWSGTLPGREESSVTFSSKGDAVSGEIRTPEDVYEIRPAPPSKAGTPRVHILVQVDADAFSPDSAAVADVKKKQ